MRASHGYSGAVAIGLLCALLAGCATSRIGSKASGLAVDEAEIGESLATQSLEPLPDAQRLFRAQIEGGQGQGALRLTLRTVSNGDYQIEANDTFGRSLWTLRFESESGLLIDHRAGTFCRYGSSVPLPEASLEDLPLPSLPRILLGRAPVEVPPGSQAKPSGALEFQDREGGHWTFRSLDGRLTTWTYYGETGRPLAWWSGERREAVLSHRAGTQLRWTETVAEPASGGLPEASIGPDYVECEL